MFNNLTNRTYSRKYLKYPLLSIFSLSHRYLVSLSLSAQPCYKHIFNTLNHTIISQTYIWNDVVEWASSNKGWRLTFDSYECVKLWIEEENLGYGGVINSQLGFLLEYRLGRPFLLCNRNRMLCTLDGENLEIALARSIPWFSEREWTGPFRLFSRRFNSSLHKVSDYQLSQNL